MRVRNLMLAALGGGMLRGGMLGATTSTTIKPPPEPPWRQASHSDSAPAPAANQQDFGSYWSTADRRPTWKRHPTEYQQADYTSLLEPLVLEASKAPVPQPEATPPDTGAEAPAENAEPAQAGT